MRVVRAGVQWKDLPVDYSRCLSCSWRFQEWEYSEVFEFE